MKNKLYQAFGLLALTLCIWYSCQKNSANELPPLPSEAQNASVQDRDGFAVTMSWLQQFQSDLKKITENQSPNNTYSVAQAVGGVEALLNLSSDGYKAQAYLTMKVTRFEVNTSNANSMVGSLYQNAYDAYHNHFLTLNPTEAYPLSVDIKIDSTYGNTVKISIVTKIGVSNTCLNSIYTPTNSTNGCTVFDGNDDYRAGSGDFDDEFGPYSNPMCNGRCGGTPSCGMTPSTGWEEIQNAINQNFPKPIPSLGKCFKGFINVTKKVIWPNEIPNLGCGTVGETSGDCMNDVTLNCNYCSIYDLIATNTVPFDIPADKHFISVNLGLYYCGCGSSDECKYSVRLVASLTYGTPVFANCLLGGVGGGWIHNPVIVDLSGISSNP